MKNKKHLRKQVCELIELLMAGYLDDDAQRTLEACKDYDLEKDMLYFLGVETGACVRLEYWKNILDGKCPENLMTIHAHTAVRHIASPHYKQAIVMGIECCKRFLAAKKLLEKEQTS